MAATISEFKFYAKRQNSAFLSSFMGAMLEVGADVDEIYKLRRDVARKRNVDIRSYRH